MKEDLRTYEDCFSASSYADTVVEQKRGKDRQGIAKFQLLNSLSLYTLKFAIKCTSRKSICKCH